MAQGAIKKSSSGTQSSRRANPSAPKKGQRAIAPKRKTLVQQKGITKKYSAGLINKTERGLAEKVGHLEMLAGGKKSGRIGGDGGKGKKSGERKDTRKGGNRK